MRRLYLILTIVLLSASSWAAAAISIPVGLPGRPSVYDDAFTSSFNPFRSTPTTAMFSSVLLPSGLDHFTTVEYLGPDGDPRAGIGNATITFLPLSLVAAYTGTGSFAGYSVGVSSVMSNGTPLDLTGLNALSVSYIADTLIANFGISLRDTTGRIIGSPFDPTVPPQGAATITFPFSSFDGNTAEFDFMHVDSAFVGFYLYQPGTATISAITIVPEPSTGTLLLLAMALYGFRRRSNRQQNGLTMRCSELLRASRWLLPAIPPPSHPAPHLLRPRSQRAALRSR